MNKEREDKALKKAIGELPVLHPDEGLWNEIEASLSTAEKPPVMSHRYLKWAAMLLLPLVAGGLFLGLGHNKAGLSYSEELMPEWPMGQLINQDKEFSLFLQEECQPGRDICENPEFQSLLTELEQLSDEFNSIVTVIDESGMDEYLAKARTRLEKEEVRLKRKIVELLKG